MRIGIPLALLAIGAILVFAVTASVAGISFTAAGWVLVVAGALGLVLALAVNYEDRTVARGPRGGPPAA